MHVWLNEQCSEAIIDLAQEEVDEDTAEEMTMDNKAEGGAICRSSWMADLGCLFKIILTRDVIKLFMTGRTTCSGAGVAGRH